MSGNYLSQLGASGLRQKIIEKAREVKTGFWELAGMLYEVKTDYLWQTWGFETWKDYIDTEVSVDRPTVNQYIANYRTYRLELGVSLEELQNLDYTKARAMKNVVTSSNVLRWIEKAASVNRNSLINEVRRVQAIMAGEDPSTVAPVRNFLNLAFDDEQWETWKLARFKAHSMSGSEVDSWLVDLIFQSFLQAMED